MHQSAWDHKTPARNVLYLTNKAFFTHLFLYLSAQPSWRALLLLLLLALLRTVTIAVAIILILATSCTLIIKAIQHHSPNVFMLRPVDGYRPPSIGSVVHLPLPTSIQLFVHNVYHFMMLQRRQNWDIVLYHPVYYVPYVNRLCLVGTSPCSSWSKRTTRNRNRTTRCLDMPVVNAIGHRWSVT